MKILLVLLIALCALTACTKSPPTITAYYSIERHCSTLEERQALTKFVVDCSEAANPKSDEEGEDLVSQCERTGQRVVCPEHRHKHISRRVGGRTGMTDTVEMDSFAPPHRLERAKTP